MKRARSISVRGLSVFVGLAVFILLFYLMFYVVMPQPTVRSFSVNVSDLPLRLFLVILLVISIGKMRAPMERRFWTLLLSAMASWFIADFTFLSGSGGGLVLVVLADLSFLLFYPLLMIAAQLRPEKHVALNSVSYQQKLVMVSSVLLILWVYSYLVLIPTVKLGHSDLHYLSSNLFYVTCDLMLAMVFLVRAIRGVGRWRVIYGCISFAMTLWFMGDSIEWLLLQDRLSLSFGSPYDFLWYAPFFVLCGAVIYRDYAAFGVRPVLRSCLNPKSLRNWSIAFVLVPPALHFCMYLMSWQPSLMPMRDLSVLTGSSLMCLTAWLVFRGRDTSKTMDSGLHVLVLDEEMQRSQKMEALGRLAGGIAHDFNNLLMLIQCHLDLMASKIDQIPDGPLFRKKLNMLVDRGSGLTRQLLTFGSKQKHSPQPVQPNRLINETENLLKRTLGDHIRLVVDLDDSLWPIVIDPGLFSQILINLAINARDAMPDGGTLTIRTRNEMVGTQEKSADYKQFVRVDVIDTGVGMDDHVRDNIFEPFFTTRGDRGGTGLGLSVVYGLVTQNNGYITCNSQLGVGTRFCVHLPRSLQEHATSSEDVENGTLVKGGTETILLVEDQPDIRELTAEYLEGSGYRVVQACHGKDAIGKFADLGSVDLLLSDVIMPEMGGVELASEITRQSPSTRVLFVSGYAKDLDIGGLNGYSFEFMQKPYRLDALVSKVRDTLDTNNESQEMKSAAVS